ncbi:MAG: hypothetical protein JW841_08250 [Deltaproteobacteria bacterium]|nr:hypothetical protein [Deltaproteobacteria bacterium]
MKIILSVLLIITWHSAALADDAHYQDFLVGGRALGLGGAFTSIADDPSGIYYNPAGLGDVRGTDLQVSTSLYGFERGSIPKGLVTPVPGADNLRLEFTDLIIIPASAGFVRTFGELDSERRPRQAYGLSVVVPSYRSFTAGLGGDATDPSQKLLLRSYQRRVIDRELWTGFGIGRRMTSQLRLGISAYYILRSLTDRENVLVSEHVDVEATNTTPAMSYDRFQSVTDDITLINGSIIFIGGLRYTLTPKIAMGLSLYSPSVPIHSQVRLAFSRATANPQVTNGQPSTLENLTLSGFSKQKHAPAARFGISFIQKYKFTLSLDISFHAPVSYSLIRPNANDAERFQSFRSRLPFDPDISRRAVVNFNLGAEFLIIREVSIAGGFFSDFSSAPRIAKSPIGDQAPDVDLFGMSVSIGYFGQHTLSRLGVMYSLGTGYDVIPESDIDRLTEGQQAFRRVAYFQSFFYVFLSSTFRY